MVLFDGSLKSFECKIKMSNALATRVIRHGTKPVFDSLGAKLDQS